jgi:hypothetical protein
MKLNDSLHSLAGQEDRIVRTRRFPGYHIGSSQGLRVSRVRETLERGMIVPSPTGDGGGLSRSRQLDLSSSVQVPYTIQLVAPTRGTEAQTI